MRIKLRNTLSQVNKEERIFRLLQLLRRSPELQTVLKQSEVVPATTYSYLKTIQRAQFSEPKYLEFLSKTEGADEFQTKEIESWKKDSLNDHSDSVYDQYRVSPDEKFYADLHYFLLCFRFISTKK